MSTNDTKRTQVEKMLRAGYRVMQIVQELDTSERYVWRIKAAMKIADDAARELLGGVYTPDPATVVTGFRVTYPASPVGASMPVTIRFGSTVVGSGIAAAGGGGLLPSKAALVSIVPAPAPSLEPTLTESLASRRQTDELAALRRRTRELEAELIKAQDCQERFALLQSAKMEPAQWLAKPHVRKAVTLTPVLFTSDFQCGEVVRPEEIDGINEYNSEIFAERYQTLIEKTIRLATENTGATDFPGIVYLRGGDAISGEIHEELAQTNDLSAIPAVKMVQRQEREGIRRLADKFGRVRVISVPGNHGRVTEKSHSNGYAAHNHETTLAWWLADHFEGNPNVTFWHPPSGDAFFKVAGWNLLLAHGDRMGSRGGAGFVGPAATIARGHQKLFQNQARTGRVPDLIFTGHLHTSLKLTTGFANGSLAGYGAYARDIRADPDAPKQWLVFMSEKHKVSHHFEVSLGKQPKRSAEEFQM